MTEQALRDLVMSILRSIAPEVEEGELIAGKPLRDQVDLDSMDWLNFLVAIHERTAVEIPESDYARLATLDDIVTYLVRKAR